MNIVDVVIVFLILLCGVSGLKNGVFKQVVQTVGIALVFIISYYLKDYLANFLSYNLPFFKFGGEFQGLSTLNIILHQMIAFIIIMALLTSVLVVLIKITGIFEKILKFTIVLGIPSKILGFLVGLVEGYILVFAALFFLNQPAFNIDILNESKYMPVIVNSSPGLSNIVSKTNDTVKEMHNFILEYQYNKNTDEFNKNAINIMLKNKIIKVEYVDKLISQGKLVIPGIDVILNNYR